MKFQPLEDRVVVRRHDAETMTKGGLIIPDTVQEKPQIGTVMACGPGKLNKKGVLIPLVINVDDTVLFGKWNEDMVEIEGEKYVMLREDDIMGVMK